MIKLPSPKKVPLSTGATLLYQRNPISPAVAFGVWFSTGSKDERRSERGLSHLLEHMVFRGTKRRSAIQIAFDLESIGGQWDAFTTKECTCYFGKVRENHFEALADILADIVLYPSISEEALLLERKVIREEIRRVKESPEDLVHELFFETLFHDHPLGHPITGYVGDLNRYSRRRILAFHGRAYTPSNALFGFIGNIPLGSVVATLEKTFRFSRKGTGRRQRALPSRAARSRSMRNRSLSRSHVCIGARTVPALSREKHALLLLSNILGGGVSSRLFQRMREETGLVYSVYATTSTWKETGVFNVYFSVDPRNLPWALDIIHEVLEGIKNGDVKQEEIDSAKAQATGSILFNVENLEARLFNLFFSEFYYQRFISPWAAIRAIDRVGRDSITEVARRYLHGKKLCYVSCGPVVLKGLLSRN